MRTWRAGDIAAVVVAVLVLAGLGYVLRPQHTPTIRVDPAGATVARPTVSDNRKTMLFIGDSYVASTGLDETSYGCMAAAQLGWYCKVAAGPGTGYVSGGPANRFELDYIGESTSFDERISGLGLEYQPDIVVLDGGRNDLFVPPDTVYDAMVSTITDVRRTWPAATVVMIRPRFLSRPADNLGYDDAFFARLKAEEITQHMVVFADPLGRLGGTDTTSLAAADGVHPTREGELKMAMELRDSLVDLGFVSAK